MIAVGKDEVHRTAQTYDRLVEPLVGGLRRAGLGICPPRVGMSVLDVGCGTGTQLALYLAMGCQVSGVETSPAMLQAARQKLGGAADLRLEDATRMSFPDGAFDLVMAAFLFHVVPVGARPALLGECLRVLKGEGHLLAIDYQPGSLSFPAGWVWRWVATCIERMAGSEHYANYGSFLAQGGLPALAAAHHLSISAPHTAAGGVLAVYVLSPENTASAPSG